MLEIEKIFYGHILNINGKYYFNCNNEKINISKLGKFSHIYKTLNFNYNFLIIDTSNFIDTIKIKNIYHKNHDIKIVTDKLDSLYYSLSGNKYMVYKLKVIDIDIYILENINE